MKCFRGTANHRQTRHRDLYNLQPTNTFVWQLLHNIKRVKSGPSGRHITAAKHSGVKLSVRGGQRAQLLSHITVVSERFQLPRWDMVFLASDQGFFSSFMACKKNLLQWHLWWWCPTLKLIISFKRNTVKIKRFTFGLVAPYQVVQITTYFASSHFCFKNLINV